MKLRIMCTLLLWTIQSWADPLLVVVLMVKDEAPVIVKTLQPFVDGGVKDFIIFDTGSTDGTQEVAANFFKQHGIVNVHIIEEPFVDFSTSRNHALEAVERVFPQATFMLMPDAEWYMHGADGLLEFCAQHKDDNQPSYLVSIRNAQTAFYVARLIRCCTNARFVGVVHEVLNHITTVKAPYDSYFEWGASKKGQEKTALRWLRDRDLLLKEYEKHPDDARTLFYLAQTYDNLDDIENAYMYYEKRLRIQGWDEENYMAMYRLGNVALAMIAQDDTHVCPLAVQHYLKAFSMRPHRAEPLIKIAQYYVNRSEMHLAFLFALRSVQIPYPTKDILFVDKYLYDFTRYDILGRCAWYVGEYAIGEWAVRKALEFYPDAPHLHNNLNFYIDRKNNEGLTENGQTN